jgi:NAD-dependent dihydropyrimidine dehydrogenase PreA subunit
MTMAKVAIEDKGCRGCTLCVDLCPVDVFDYDEGKDLAKVARGDDCIGCFSCFYACPSQCVDVDDVEMMRPFHRVEENVAFVEKFLQAGTATTTLKAEDYEEAHRDVAARLYALSSAVTETMGRAQKAVGRKAGSVAATHLPEMYEEEDLSGVLGRMQKRFKNAFDFDFKLDGEDVELTFNPCGLLKVVTDQGDKVGDAVLCHLFHEYWTGLVSTFTSSKYKCEVPQAGETCLMRLNRV